VKISTHNHKVLKKIYDNEPLTASQINVSNANQYLIQLESAKLIVRRWYQDGKKRFKLAFINREKLEEVEKILGVKYE